MLTFVGVVLTLRVVRSHQHRISAPHRAPGIRAPGVSADREEVHSLVEPLGACLVPAFLFLVLGFRFLRPAAPGAASAELLLASGCPPNPCLKWKCVAKHQSRTARRASARSRASEFRGVEQVQRRTAGRHARPKWTTRMVVWPVSPNYYRKNITQPQVKTILPPEKRRLP